MHSICFDYGTRRIGVALASTPIAEPLEVIPNTIQRNDEIITPAALQRIVKLLADHQIDRIIVGISEEQMAVQTRRFIEKLRSCTDLEIEEMDETLSSYEAYQHMKSLKKSKRDGVRDHYAAAQILQNYLDSHEDALS